MKVHDLEKLKHVAPNTGEVQRPYKDQRFFVMWCPFHKARRVPLLGYVTDWDDLWFNCAEGCHCIQDRIEHLLTRKQPHITSYVSPDTVTIVYEARWSLGS